MSAFTYDAWVKTDFTTSWASGWGTDLIPIIACGVTWFDGRGATWLDATCRDWLNLPESYSLDTFGETTGSLMSVVL